MKILSLRLALALVLPLALTGCPDDDDDSAVADDDDDTGDDDDATGDDDDATGDDDDATGDDDDSSADDDDATPDPDEDGDGIPASDDCDDADPNNFPGNDEVCDGADNDCDTVADNDLDFVDYWLDGDADGIGAGDAVSTCDGPPADHVDVDGDCDDADADNYPGNPEVCDGADNDCDTVADNGIAFVDYFADGDGDGVGAGAAVSTCDGAPADHVAVDGDCDDGDADNFPGNTEVCDGADNDCDTLLSADEIDDDGDGQTECDGDCDDADSDNFDGNTEVCDGQDNDCDTLLSTDETDDDGDGQTECDGDCDDTDSDNFDGNTEVCDGADNDCDTLLSAQEIDGDGDGQTECDGDCDDAEVTAFTGAIEATCTGIDEDCDPTTSDEPDGDADGASVCDDCDDTDPSVGDIALDGDCDGELDADDCSPEDPLAFTGNGGSEACAALSCLDIVAAGYDTGDGDYWLDPNGTGAALWPCDMSTDDGGWTGITLPAADAHLFGIVVTIDAAGTAGFDPALGPFTQDGAGGHAYQYDFTFGPGLSELYLGADYLVQCNAASGDTCDVWTCWNQTDWTDPLGATCASLGDVAWGTPDEVGPVTSLAADVPVDTSMPAGAQTGWITAETAYSITPTTLLRVAWSEKGSQAEGWYPWYAGTVWVR